MNDRDNPPRRELALFFIGNTIIFSVGSPEDELLWKRRLDEALDAATTGKATRMEVPDKALTFVVTMNLLGYVFREQTPDQKKLYERMLNAMEKSLDPDADEPWRKEGGEE